jgi:hypothetical protein
MINLFTILVLQFSVLTNAAPIAAAATAAPAAEEDTKAPHESVSDQIWHGLWHAKTNMRYHIMESNTNGRWDRVTRAATVVLALVAFSGPFVFSRIPKAKALWYGVGLVALCFSLVQFVWPFGEWSANDTVLAGRWNQLAGEWYTLYEQADTLKKPEALQRIAELSKDAVQIENSETSSRFKPKVMLAAEEEEKAYQGFKDEPAPAPVPDKKS